MCLNLWSLKCACVFVVVVFSTQIVSVSYNYFAFVLCTASACLCPASLLLGMGPSRLTIDYRYTGNNKLLYSISILIDLSQIN